MSNDGHGENGNHLAHQWVYATHGVDSESHMLGAVLLRAKVALESERPPETLDLVSLLPQRWAAFLRNSQPA